MGVVIARNILVLTEAMPRCPSRANARDNIFRTPLESNLRLTSGVSSRALAVAARPRRATEIFMFSDRALVVKLFVAYSNSSIYERRIIIGGGGRNIQRWKCTTRVDPTDARCVRILRSVKASHCNVMYYLLTTSRTSYTLFYSVVVCVLYA